MEALKLSELNMTLPFFDINTGIPSPAPDEIAEIDLSRTLHPNPGASFIIRVKGDSMSAANIPDGCLAVVDRALKPSTGDIIAGVLDGEFTIKRLVKAGRHWVLHPENPFYKPFVIAEDTEFQVWGVVTAVIVDIRK
ncbi:LexA family protein [Chitinophaga solisilvae]|uniref:Translesion error-prone DNA polymerase V autoproteolytic subunit n=1 Tax=Chitinophaga solisilvae TaxID=1233460 RepID=A0A9Q5DER3_9BACT|nr:translesion error-prone DNA polymerase V autoproteolytic subunit [Chitinophaga solisilvae]NSL90405.1 translesion error-prone DNA polymerase V autoproteolytic subunit [Chitinophaga solisilvae]